jgi:hypothetical protein
MNSGFNTFSLVALTLAITLTMLAGATPVTATAPDTLYLVFELNGQPIAVERTPNELAAFVQDPVSISDTDGLIQSLYFAWAAGPSESEQNRGIRGWLAVTKADHVTVADSTVTLYVTLPLRFLTQELTWERNDAVLRAMAAMVTPDMPITTVSIKARAAEHESQTFEYRTLDAWIAPEPPVEPKPFETTEPDATRDSGHRAPAQPGAPGQGMYPGSLWEKSVFISQAHGWYSNGSYWLTQRPNTNDLVEDFLNAEAINQYLVHYLYNAGAGVYTCRERDVNTTMQIIDNTDPEYTDEGGWWSTTSVPGYYGADYRAHPVTVAGHGYASWMFTPETAGFYEVYAWYNGAHNRSEDARYTISHNGGDTVVIQNQQRDGFTWKSFGRYVFDPADPVERRRVTLSTEGSDTSQFVIADAVRFGGGMGSIADPMVSNRPRWEESGRYFAEFMGCSTCGASTVTAMPRYAAWEHEAWEDSVYISWHTNAPNPGTGTETYIHNTAPYPGSDVLRDWIHDQLINDIRAGYDPNWTDRGKRSANFGEINSANNNEMPAMLIELAFHDTPSDALYLKDPKFRMLAARAIYQGIEKYYADKDGRPVHLLPEPPELFSARNIGDGMVQLEWTAPPYDSGNGLLGHPAEAYRVCVSETGLGFADAVDAPGTAITLGPFPEGSVRYFKVSATNTGGESFPTSTLAVKIPEAGHQADMLLVHAFNRLDRFALVPQYESGPLGTVLRMFLDRMNTFNYTVSHAKAAADFPGGFDSCINTVVGAGLINLDDYRAVNWIAGEESTVDETFSSAEQAVVMDYLDNGGALFASGSELAWDLDWRGTEADRYFCHHYLKAAYDVDDAESDILVPVPGSIADGLDIMPFDYDLYQIYGVEYPDGLFPVNGSVGILTYQNTSHVAAVAYDGDFRVVTMGMPLETILSADHRKALMERILEFLMPPDDCLNTGDVDGSGTITAADAQLAFMIALGLMNPTYEQACAADCNGDGQVTAADAQMIFYVALGILPQCADPA